MKFLFGPIFLAVLLSGNNAFAWGEEKYCLFSDVKSGKCSKGDLLYVSPSLALKLCDFDERVVSFSSGNESDINARAICFYRGSERNRR